MTPFRETVRSLLRDRLLDAAYELVAPGGWGGMRMTHLASRAGVSRQTVYTEFGSKDAIGEALVMREVERFLVGIQEQLDANRDDLAAATVAGVAFTLREAADNHLLKSIFTSARGGNEDLLALVAVRSDQLLRTAQDALDGYVSDAWPRIDPLSRSLAIETVVRITVSHIVQPVAPAEETAERVAEIVMRVALPGAGT
ncbi:TetR family transcriptional regulator [Spirillospora albida]|uniref:TetR family transcriptional regulator n=1 Tax=Spirillospora albida TaxID=58123 RepID=UPI0004C0E4B7|nr:TetR family transcriptional regulator [Spirillospora albida]